MKKHKKTLTVVIILIVALLMFASFFGVYKKNENGEKVSILPNLKLGMEFGKTRVITASVNNNVNKVVYDAEGNVVKQEEGVEYTEENGYKIKETPINADSVKTVDNYKRAEKTIEKRLKENNITEYAIDLDETNGTIKLEIPENDTADDIESLIKNSGTLLLLDGETFETVFDNSYLKKADVVYSQGTTETGVFLQLEFNEEGTKKLQELNNIYVKTTEEQTKENGETENVTKSKNVWVILNDKFLGATVLPNIVYNDKIMLTFGLSNNTSEIQTAVKEAQKEAVLLNSGVMPLSYEYSNETRETNITENKLFVYEIAIGIVFVVAYIYLVVKFKAKGFIAVYFQVGYLGILLLILRLTSAIITIEGLAGIVIAMVLEYIFTYIVLRNLSQNTEGMYKKANLEFFLNTLPIYIIAIVFTFASRVNISSFGMSLFWGILLIYVYNFIFPKYIFENLNGRSK